MLNLSSESQQSGSSKRLTLHFFFEFVSQANNAKTYQPTEPPRRSKMKPSYFIHSSLHKSKRYQKHQRLEGLHYNMEKKCLYVLLTSFLQFCEWCSYRNSIAYPLTSFHNSFLAYSFFDPIFLKPVRIKHPWRIVTNKKHSLTQF